MASKLAKPNDKVDLACVKTWFHCRSEKCSRWLYSIPALKEHFKVEHPGELLTLPDNLSSEVMEGHVELEEKPELRTWKVNCRAGCFKSFRSQSELNFHMKKHSKCYIPYAHDQNSSKTGNYSNAAPDGDPPQPIGTKAKNNPRKPVKSRGKCPSQPILQQKAASSSSAKAKSSDSRHFHCHTCGKSFFKRYNLARHIATHSGERTFQCNICKGRFSRKDVLNVHLRTVHKKKTVTNHTAIAVKIIKGVKRVAKLVAVGGKPQKMAIIQNKALAGHDGRRHPKRYESSGENEQVVDRKTVKQKHSITLPDGKGELRAECSGKKSGSSYACHLCPFKGRKRTWVKNHRRLHEQGAAAVICPVCNWYVSPSALAVHHSRRHGTALDSAIVE